MASATSPLLVSTILGTIELSGCSPGANMLAGDGGMPYEEVLFGIAKSSISLLRMKPREDRLWEPQLLVRESVDFCVYGLIMGNLF